MKAIFKYLLGACGLAIAVQALGQITLYEHSGFRGQSITVERTAASLERYGFNNRASSVVVSGGSWEVCTNPGFAGHCAVLPPGRHASLAGMNDGISSVRPVGAGGTPGYPPPQSGGQITFHERRDFRGGSITANGPVPDFNQSGLNNRASSVVVSNGSWEVCDGPGFSGRCVVLRPGQYPSLNEMGLNNRISSARPVAAVTPRPGLGQVTLYEHSNFRGRSVTLDRRAERLEGFRNAASSAVITGGSWEFCDRREFGGRCVVLSPGRYPSLGSMGMNDNVSSLRPAR